MHKRVGRAKSRTSVGVSERATSDRVVPTGDGSWRRITATTIQRPHTTHYYSIAQYKRWEWKTWLLPRTAYSVSQGPEKRSATCRLPSPFHFVTRSNIVNTACLTCGRGRNKCVSRDLIYFPCVSVSRLQRWRCSRHRMRTVPAFMRRT
jgi:hypothetical protein